MNRMLKDWGFALVVGAVVYLGARWWSGQAPPPAATAPAFAVQTLDGQDVALDGLRGRTVILNFWASWCGPCRAEIPEFSRFAKANPDVAVIGLAVDSGDEASVRDAADRFGIHYPVAVASNAVQRAYGVTALPTTFVIGPDGAIKASNVGPMSVRDLETAIR